MTALNAIDVPFVHHLGWTLVHSVWQVTLVSCALACLLAVMRGRSANMRYVTAYAALVLAAALPVCTMLALSIDAGGADTAPGTAVGTATPATMPADVSTAGTAAEPTGFSLDRFNAWIEPLLPGLSLLWFAGMMATALWNLGGWLQARRLMTRGVTPAPGQWITRMTDMCGRLGIHRPVRLLESSKAGVPMAAGLLKPVILLPAAVLTGLAPHQIEALLAHEIAHIRRHDYLANLVQTALVTLLFYHPAVWWISRIVRNEREHCCDDDAVALCGDRVVYARALVAAQELGGGSPALVVASNHGVLLSRVRRIVGAGEPNTYGFAPAIAGVLLAVCVCLGAGGERLPLKPEQAEMMGRVEDFFMHNYRDITARKSLEWGEVKQEKDGNYSILYTYRGTIWDKDKMIFSETYTFAPDGTFVRVSKTPGYPKKENPPDVNSKEGMMALVEDFFSKNYRDITSRETLEWGEVQKLDNGNTSIRYKCLATIWDKDKKTLNLVFTFNPQGEFVSVEDTAAPSPVENSAEVAPPAISTPEETVTGFTKAAMAGNVDLAQAHFLPGGEDYDDVREALEDSEDVKTMFGAIDPEAPITVVSKEGDENQLKVVWRVTFNKSFELERHKFEPGSTYDFDATLKKTDKGWLIDNF